jgi:hypothetical protein
VNTTKFLTDALTSALDQSIATPDDVVRHVTPDVLSAYLPRPLWARLLTACLGAPRVDARLVIETVGVANLCEHVPAQVTWACLADVAARALGKPMDAIPAPVTTKQSSSPARAPLTAPAPPEVVRPRALTPAPVAPGPAIPQPVADDAARAANAQRFRQSNTGLGRIGQPGARRPQAAAVIPTPATPAPHATTGKNVVRRGQPEVLETETETAVESEWKSREMAVDDSQLVDWSTESTESRDDDFGDIGRKR